MLLISLLNLRLDRTKFFAPKRRTPSSDLLPGNVYTGIKVKALDTYNGVYRLPLNVYTNLMSRTLPLK